MPRVSKIEPIILRVAESAGTEGVTVAQLADAVDQELEGQYGMRGVEHQVKRLFKLGKLGRRFDYYYPTLQDGSIMKSPVRRHVYYASASAFFVPGLERP